MPPRRCVAVVGDDGVDAQLWVHDEDRGDEYGNSTTSYPTTVEETYFADDEPL